MVLCQKALWNRSTISIELKIYHAGLLNCLMVDHFWNAWVLAQLLHLCPTLCDPWTVAHQASLHGILQARLLEWVAMPSSRESSRPRDWTCISYVSCTLGGFFIHWFIWEVHFIHQIRSDEISRSVVSDSLRPHESQHASLLYIQLYIHTWLLEKS